MKSMEKMGKKERSKGDSRYRLKFWEQTVVTIRNLFIAVNILP